MSKNISKFDLFKKRIKLSLDYTSHLEFFKFGKEFFFIRLLNGTIKSYGAQKRFNSTNTHYDYIDKNFHIVIDFDRYVKKAYHDKRMGSRREVISAMRNASKIKQAPCKKEK